MDDTNLESDLVNEKSDNKATVILAVCVFVIFGLGALSGYWVTFHSNSNQTITGQLPSNQNIEETTVSHKDISTSTLQTETLSQTEIEDQYRQDLIESSGTGCWEIFTDGDVPKLVCTDSEAEAEFFLNRCLGSSVRDFYGVTEKIDGHLTKYPDSVSSKEGIELLNRWSLVKDCSPLGEKNWFGFYDQKTKEIYYFAEADESSKLIGALQGDLPKPFFILAECGAFYCSNYRIVDLNKEIYINSKAADYGKKFVKVIDILDAPTEFNNDAGKWYVVLDKGIVFATVDGLTVFDYQEQSYRLIVSTPSSTTLIYPGGHGDSASLNQTGPNSFEYELYTIQGDNETEWTSKMIPFVLE